MKTCTKCQRLQSMDRFSSLKHTRDGKQSWCKECMAAHGRKTYGPTAAGRSLVKKGYRATRRQERRDYNRAWRAANLEKARQGARLREARRRARMRGNLTLPFTPDQLTARLSMWGGCWRCGGVADQVDHVKPISKGGPHILANLRPICGSCNQSKRDHWPLVA